MSQLTTFFYLRPIQRNVKCTWDLIRNCSGDPWQGVSYHNKIKAIFKSIYICKRFGRTEGDCTLFIYNKKGKLSLKRTYKKPNV